MSISSVTSGQASLVDTGATASGLNQDYNTFLQLLVSQIKYQDPTDPVDGTQFVSQLAQLSQVEQSTKTNDQIAALRASLAVSGALYQSSLVGKGVTAPTETLVLDEKGGSVDFTYQLAADASDVTAYVSDAAGNVIRTIKGLDGKGNTLYDIVWDGKNDAGDAVETGSYTISLGANSQDSGYETYTRQKVTGVVYAHDEEFLQLENGQSVSLGDVVRID